MKTTRLGFINSLLGVIVFTLLASILLPKATFAFTGAGAGTSANPYKISTCDQLQEIADELSAHYALVDDIDCTGTTLWNAGAGFLPIGTSTNNTFSGVLDGRNRIINGLFINTSGNNVGMFAYLSGTVKNLSMTSVDITSSSGTNHGSLVAEAIGATIESVAVQGDFNGNQRVGGLAGFVRDGSTISKSSFTGTSTDTSSYGAGFVGWVSSSTISDSYAQADYDGNNAGAGFVNRIYTSDANDATIDRSYFVGDVINPNYGASFLSQLDEYSTGQVAVNDSFVVGTGFNGTNNIMRPFSSLKTGTPTVSNFYFDQTAATNSSCGSTYTCTAVNTDGLDPDHFKANSTAPPLDTWDFTNVWQVDGSGYPTLRTATLEPMGYGLSGAGTEGDPFQITDCEELQSIDDYDTTSGVYFELMNNIDCSDTINWDSGDGFLPIGSTYDDFAGDFDGGGFTISDLYIDRSGDDNVGLFGLTTSASNIHDLTLVDAVITGDSEVGTLVGDNTGDVTNVTVTNTDVTTSGYYVGGMVGYSGAGDFTNVHVTGYLYADDEEGGGIIGQYDGGTLSNCSFSGTLETYYESGGIIGENEGPVTIHRCFSEGTITAGDTDTGGIVGEAEDELLITESFSNMTIDGDDAGGIVGTVYGDTEIRNSYYNGESVGTYGDVGSVVGYASSSYDLTITNVYGTGVVSGTSDEGGFIGDSHSSVAITNSFWNKSTTGFSEGCAIPSECEGATGLTTAQMQTSTPFLSAGWDFDSVWGQKAGYNASYPCLQWIGEECTGSINSQGQDDSDFDGAGDSVEDAAPNSGDANNDGTADSEQDNVASFVNNVSGEYSVLEVSEECSITSVEAIAEADVSDPADSDYDYPAGMLDFVLDCGQNGFTATITQYHYGIEGDFLVRKYKPSAGYFTIETASTSDQTISGLQVKVATYQVQDGSNLDLDGEANGTIEDPAGLAEAAGELSSTGADIYPMYIVVVTSLLLAMGLIYSSSKLKV